MGGVIGRVAHVKLSRLLLDGLDPVEESAQPPFHVATRQPAHTHTVDRMNLELNLKRETVSVQVSMDTLSVN